MDQKTLEYLASRVDESRKIIKEIDRLDSLQKDLDEGRDFNIGFRASNGIWINSRDHLEIHQERTQEFATEIIQARVTELQGRLEII